MKILLVSENRDLKELLSFQISSRLKAQVKECSSARDAVELLRNEPDCCELLLAPYNGPNSVLVKHLRGLPDPLPTLFFYDPLVVSPDAESLAGLDIVAAVEQARLVDGVIAALEGFLHRQEHGTGASDEFCPIRTNLLIRVSPLKSDIYIRLSETKFVKLFRPGDEFDAADLERYYQTKKVEYMYLRRSETEEFVKKFRRELEELLLRNDLNKEEQLAASENAHEVVLELVHRVGFSDEVQEIAKRNVELTLKAVGSNPRLSDLIGKIQGEGNYLAQHSALLAHVACCVAKEMDWGSEATFSKLVLAAYLHDISLKNPEISKIVTLKELAEKKDQFPDDDVKSYHLHPARSADLARSFKEVPADVDIIVQQHHERPNGGGFPRGLLFNYIAPLSSVFIVAHDMTQEMLNKGAVFQLPAFVAQKKAMMNQGNFKKVFSALEKMKP